MSAGTLKRWLREPEFAAAYRKASAAVLDGAVGRLQAGLVDASETLLRNLSASRASVQVNAAKSILDLVNFQAQLSALAAQLQALEQRLASKQQGD